MKNRNMMSSLTGGPKIFLLVCLALTFVADFTVTVVLGVQGITGGHFVFPLFFAIFDLIFLIEAIFSNFRFAYTVKHLVIYVVFSAAILFFTVVFNIFGAQIIYSNVAAASWITVHLLALFGTICCYLYAAKRIKGNVAAQTAVTVAVTAIYVVLIVVYAVSLFGLGFFGQGGVNTRPLLYEYDEETETYAVKGVLYGSARSIYVPEEFNGKKIAKVSSDIFFENGVDSITLDCSTDVEFTDGFYGFAYYADGITIYADREDADVFKQKFYDIYERDSNEAAALQFANAVVPYDLEKDEVYVTFAYSDYDFGFVKNSPLKTWIGKKGDVFDMSYFKDSPYANYSDRTNDEHLYWNYYNNGKYILSEISLNGVAVNESVKGLTIDFERVYKIIPGASNDTVHTTDVDFNYSVIGGKNLGYKLTVSEYADDILADFDREGFEINWFYSLSDYPYQKSRFTSLKENVLGKTYYDEYPEYTIYPDWEMNEPEIVLSSNGNDNSFIYGDDAELTAAAKSDVKNARFQYSWWRSNTWLPEETGALLSIPCIERSDSAIYDVKVTVTSPDSSLTSSETISINIKVDQRQLNIEWTYPANSVFDGTDKITYCRIQDGGIINGDNISLVNEQFSRSAAGTYNFTNALAYSSKSNNYKLVNPTGTFTIQKAPLMVVWGGETLTYNRTAQSPSTKLSGLIADADEVYVSSTTYTNAGTYDFKATISGSDSGNYYLENPTQRSTILPYGVTVKWNINATLTNGNETTYDGTSFLVTASATGFDVYITVNPDISRITDAGTYEINATIGSSYSNNYYIAEGGTQTYIIKPRPVSVNWNKSTLYYNGYLQYPEYTITGVGGLKLNAVVECDGKDAGTGYTATVTAIAPSESYLYSNYILSDNTSCSYSIERCPMKVLWGSLELVYNGKPQAPEAYINGFGDEGKLPLVLYDFSNNVNVNTYHAVADPDVNRQNYPNYSIINNGTDYNIIKRTLTYKATDVTIYEGDELPQLTYIYSGFINGQENVGIVVSDIKVTVEGFTGKVGTYKNFIIITGKVSGDGVDNYEVKFEYGTLTVLPREGRNAV